MRLRLSGPGPTDYQEEVGNLKWEMETFQKRAQILVKENVDLRDSVHQMGQMLLTGS